MPTIVKVACPQRLIPGLALSIPHRRPGRVFQGVLEVDVNQAHGRLAQVTKAKTTALVGLSPGPVYMNKAKMCTATSPTKRVVFALLCYVPLERASC